MIDGFLGSPPGDAAETWASRDILATDTACLLGLTPQHRREVQRHLQPDHRLEFLSPEDRSHERRRAAGRPSGF